MSTCPVCRKPASPADHPFCSDRCRHVDLNRWFTESYTVPAIELDDADAEDIAVAEAAKDARSHEE